MNKAQTLAIDLHDYLSDREIAETVGVTREYMCKIRNGSKLASATLENKLQLLTDRLFEDASTEDTTQEYTGFSISRNLVIIGIIVMVLCIIVVSCIQHTSRHTALDETSN